MMQLLPSELLFLPHPHLMGSFLFSLLLLLFMLLLWLDMPLPFSVARKRRC